jgi:FixJ family two-component response regulator
MDTQSRLKMTHASTINVMTEKAGRCVYVVDDDESARRTLSSLLRSIGLEVDTFESTEAFLQTSRPALPSCLVLDVRLKGESGLAFQRRAQAGEIEIPIIIVTGHADVPMTVSAMKAGAIDFFTKPVREQDLLDSVVSALSVDAARLEREHQSRDLRSRYGTLTPREKEIVPYVVAGLLNKQIADRLSISEVTVKIHRRAAMQKLGMRSLAELVREAQTLKIAPLQDQR